MDAIILEIKKGEWLLEELPESAKKEFIKRELGLDHIDGCAECGAYKGKSIDNILQKIDEGIFTAQNKKLICKKHVAKKSK